jgi:4,5-dihydroxyphthalate decarboxylase
MKEQRVVFGADPWPYNLEENRTNLEVAVRYAYNERIIKTMPKLEDLFFPPSLEEAKRYL